MRLTSIRRRIRTARTEPDAGYTLAEVLVATGLSSILGALTLTLFVNVTGSVQDTTDRTIASGQGRNVLQAWTSYLQVADGTTAGMASHRIEWLTPTDMLFHANLDNRASAAPDSARGTTDTVWLRLVGSRLVEQRRSSMGITCRVLADHVSATRLFTGYDALGADQSGVNLGQPLSTSTALCPTMPTSVAQPDATANTNLQNVQTVKIDFWLTEGRGIRSAEYSATAVLPALSGATS